MNNVVTLAATQPAQQRRLRSVVKRLGIDLGYLEHCLAEGLQDSNVRKAAKGLDNVIDYLNLHLTR